MPESDSCPCPQLVQKQLEDKAEAARTEEEMKKKVNFEMMKIYERGYILYVHIGGERQEEGEGKSEEASVERSQGSATAARKGRPGGSASAGNRKDRSRTYRGLCISYKHSLDECCN